MTLLQVEDLTIGFGSRPAVVTSVSFTLTAGDSLGLVGESGSGKSSIALACMGLLPSQGTIRSGSVRWRQKAMQHASPAAWNALRGREMAMIFQDPMMSLNPLLRIETQLCEHQRQHFNRSKKAAKKHAIDLLEQVGIADAAQRIRDYPHQFSGGQRQRIMIASALACEPALLVADEPTTALDVHVQAEILTLLDQLRKDRQLALLLISHDLGVVHQCCSEVVVLKNGRAVEKGSTQSVFTKPAHPDTQQLLAALPRLPREVTDG